MADEQHHHVMSPRCKPVRRVTYAIALAAAASRLTIQLRCPCPSHPQQRLTGMDCATISNSALSASPFSFRNCVTARSNGLNHFQWHVFKVTFTPNTPFPELNLGGHNATPYPAVQFSRGTCPSCPLRDLRL